MTTRKLEAVGNAVTRRAGSRVPGTGETSPTATRGMRHGEVAVLWSGDAVEGRPGSGRLTKKTNLEQYRAGESDTRETGQHVDEAPPVDTCVGASATTSPRARSCSPTGRPAWAALHRLAIGLLYFWCLAIALPATSQTPRTRQVLVLYDERTDLPGLALLDAGFLRALDEVAAVPFELYREELELSRFEADGYQDRLRRHLREKYSEKQLDVVVTVMGPSLDFLLASEEPLFGNVPIVFCGIDRQELGGRELPPRVTGVLLERDFASTLEIALELHPDTRRVVFVAGTSEFDTRLLNEARRQFRPFERRVQLTYLTGLPLDEVLGELSRLEPNTLVLYSTVFQDSAGRSYVPHAVAERISAASPVPVYGFVDQYLGYGIVGGHLYGLGPHGAEAARLVGQILRGADPADLPLVEATTSTTMFDWNQLRRWGIADSRLPVGSTIRFRPSSLWHQYRWFVLAAICVAGAQALVIGGLLAQRARRRRVETKLRESELRFRTMADTAPVMIWLSDSDGHFTFLNRAWLDFTGDPPERQIGCTWTDYVHPDDLERCRQVHRESLARPQSFSLSCRLRRSDGAFRWVVCSGSPRLSIADEHLGVVGSCTDVTAQREAELEMQRHRTELAHLGRVATVGVLTSAVAHELRQPLAAIRTNADAAVRFLDADPPDLGEVREILADIREDDVRAAEIIRRLRELLHKREVVRTPIDLDELVTKTFHLLQGEAAARRVSLRREVAQRLPRVLGEPVHLQQVLVNLVLNGFDAMAETKDGEKELTVRTSADGNGTVQIDVADSGPGVPPGALPRLFDPFFSTKHDGLGMGLAISKSIVDAHEGRIWAENNERGGATFHVTLPAASTGKADAA